MKRMLSLILICVMLLAGCGTAALTWQEQYDLGVRYLSEGNYKEAILAFTAAIEIDPKEPDAYVRLAEIYTELGEEEKLNQIIAAAVAQFGDSFRDMLLQDESEAEPETEPETETEQEPLEEEIQLLQNGDPITVSGVVQYSDESNDIGNGYCFIDGLDTIHYQFQASDPKDGTPQSSTQTIFTKGDGTGLMKQYVDLTVTISGKFYADFHGIPYITEITVMESSGEPRNAEPLVMDDLRCLQKEWMADVGCYHVPQLNLPGGMGQEFNTQIQQTYNEFCEEMFSRGCNFEWYQYEDTIVILLQEFANAPCVKKNVYSISAQSGKELTKAEILARYGITEAEFAEKVNVYMDEFLQKTVWELTNSMMESDPEGAQWYMQDANWATDEAYSEENLKLAKPYIGKDGQLCFVFYVPSVVQNDDWFLVNYHTGETYSIPECEVAHNES